MDDIIIELTSTGTFAIAVFGAVFCLMQTKRSPVASNFSAFLAAVAVNNGPDAFRRLTEAMPAAYGPAIDVAVWPSSFLLAPLFWMYVFTLTSSAQRRPARLARHFVLPGLAICVALLVLVSPPHVSEALTSDNVDLDAAWTIALAVCMGLLQLAVYPQIAVYLFLTVRRLVRFRLKLRDVYASTEQHELRWIYVIGGLGGLFWLSQTALLFFALDAGQTGIPPSYNVTASMAGTALVAAAVLWGLRQRPPLVPDPADPEPISPTVPPTGARYEKSSLSAEASERIARKLRAAMEADHLYRNPDLSLWALARHTGASPNYISQTLNEKIGLSFFDFVNGYRVAEAQNLLTMTDRSVLTITYDVGFNARSSFYSAFKRLTGQTPSAYRKKMSQRDGLDDSAPWLRDT
ncbi:AraC family transcriptional regulator [uncultured Roseobacter sp.]|uniref:helix-turn-helix domain-containing protein n=1 Tax=uncultured Roseobacter sp. TaxID=114847 RepID=UPI00261D5CE8|nr:AraC family transcriptional regulator [uncultured Roseobacter sp.]